MTTGQRPDRPRRPSGAAVVVISRSPDGPRYLLLHNTEFPTDEDGDWAWGPPSGCLEPDEDITACAARELFEETGIRGDPQPVATESVAWSLFFLEVPWGTEVRLDDAEHNDFAWVTYEDACEMCRPELVAEGLQMAVTAARASTSPSGNEDVDPELSRKPCP